tara:strand:- start:1118 stop:2233 length:1116 start_codon:yes stop_codon:yes gene_type:complete
MEKIIFKKITYDIVTFFIYAIFSTTIIIWVIQAVNFLDIVSEDGHSYGIYFTYTLLNLPKIVSKILPFVFLISIFNIITKYEAQNELIIYWLLGVNKITLINKILKISFYFIIIQIFLTSYFVPLTLEKARSYFKTSGVDLFTSIIKEKKFIDTVKNLTIFIEEKNHNQLKKIMLKEKITNNESQIIIAATGEIVNYTNDKGLVLYNGKIIKMLKENQNIITFSEFKFNLNKYKTNTVTMTKIQENNTKNLLICLKKIFSDTDYLSDDQSCEYLQKQNMIEELFKRIYSPIYILLLALISSLIIINSKNNKKYSLINILIFLSGTALIIISEISLGYSAKNIVTAIFYIMFPIMLFLLIYTCIIYNLKNNK